MKIHLMCKLHCFEAISQSFNFLFVITGAGPQGPGPGTQARSPAQGPGPGPGPGPKVYVCTFMYVYVSVCVAAACGASATSEKARPWIFEHIYCQFSRCSLILGPPGFVSKSGQSSQMTMPARRASKFCAKRRALSPEVFSQSLIY